MKKISLVTMACVTAVCAGQAFAADFTVKALVPFGDYAMVGAKASAVFQVTNNTPHTVYGKELSIDLSSFPLSGATITDNSCLTAEMTQDGTCDFTVNVSPKAAAQSVNLNNNVGILFSDSFSYKASGYDNTDVVSSWKNTNINRLTASTLYVNGNTLLLGAKRYGILKSTDDGANWSTVFLGNGQADQIVVGYGSEFYAAYHDLGLLESTGGDSWTVINNSDNLKRINTVQVEADHDIRYVYAGTTDRGVFVSLDDGKNFRTDSTGLPEHVKIRKLLLESDTRLYAATDKGLYVTSNPTSANWQLVSSALPSNVNNVLVTATGQVAVATDQGVYIAPAYGQPFVQFKSGMVDTNVTALAEHPTTNNRLEASTDDGIYELANTTPGTSWTKIRTVSGVKSLVFDDYESNVYRLYEASEQHGLEYLNLNGSTWRSVSTSIPNLFVNQMMMDAQGTCVAAAGYEGVLVSTEPNCTMWTTLNTGIPSTSRVTAITQDGDDAWLAGTNKGVVYRHTLSASGWTAVASSFGAPVKQITDNGSTIYVATEGNGVYKSIDEGRNFSAVNDGITDPKLLSFHIDQNGVLYAGSERDGLFISRNAGRTWGPSHFGVGNAIVTAIATPANSNDSIYVGTWGEGVFVSTDNAANFNAVNQGLPEGAYIWSLTADNKGDVFATTAKNGVYVLNHGNQEWMPFSAGLDTNLLNMSSLMTNGSLFFLGGYGSGLYSASLPQS